MNDLTTDRSGRTLKDYRELYWQSKDRIAELEAEPARLQEILLKQTKLNTRVINEKTEQQATIERVRKAVIPVIEDLRASAATFRESDYAESFEATAVELDKTADELEAALGDKV